jgi:hypothetical protein
MVLTLVYTRFPDGPYEATLHVGSIITRALVALCQYSMLGLFMLLGILKRCFPALQRSLQGRFLM